MTRSLQQISDKFGGSLPSVNKLPNKLQQLQIQDKLQNVQNKVTFQKSLNYHQFNWSLKSTRSSHFMQEAMYEVFLTHKFWTLKSVCKNETEIFVDTLLTVSVSIFLAWDIFIPWYVVVSCQACLCQASKMGICTKYRRKSIIGTLNLLLRFTQDHVQMLGVKHPVVGGII